MRRFLLTSAPFVLFSSLLAGQATADVKVSLELVADTLVHPVTMVPAPDGSKRRFIVEQRGTIQVLMPDGTQQRAPFLDISNKIVKLDHEFDERGLLGLAFHPKFKDNGKFYVYYSAPMRVTAPRRTRLYWNHTSHVSEFRLSKGDPKVADPSSERILLQIDEPQFNHNGGSLNFGPDGYLYISTGDGGYANDDAIGHSKQGNAQDLSNLLGKILRIDVNSGDPYAVPKDNPFVGKKDVMPEIWAYGLRNPWRCSFDMGGKHELYCGDVGQNTYETVKLIEKGGNYGWNRVEGTHCFNPADPNNHPASCDKSGLIPPIVEYGNLVNAKNGKGRSVTGGYIYRGKGLQGLDGAYVFGDWSKQFTEADGVLMVARPPAQKGAMWKLEDLDVTNMKFRSYVLGFGQDESGEVYVLASDNTAPGRANDKVYRIVTTR